MGSSYYSWEYLDPEKESSSKLTRNIINGSPIDTAAYTRRLESSSTPLF
jgi:hypothetical protein